MRSNIAFVALLCFALVNTAFLGYYLYSNTATFGSTNAGAASTASASVSFGTTSQAVTGTVTMTATSTNAVSSTVTEPSTTTTLPGSTVTESQSASSGTTAAETTTAATTQTSSPGYSVSTSATAALSASSSAPTSASTVSSSQTGLSTTNSASANGTFGASTAKAGAASFTAGLVSFFADHSLILAPGSWVAVGGMWIWRGRMRSKWTDLGFDSDVFTLFVRMKGAKTRIRLLDALSVPKDRLQLAEELGLDWKSVDRHVAVMKKYGFLDDKVAYGRVRMYQLTPVGMSLLKLLQELSREDKREDKREDGPYPLLDKGEA